MTKTLIVVIPLIVLSACATTTGSNVSADTRIKVVSQKEGTVRYIDRKKYTEMDQRPWWQKQPRYPGTHP